MVRILFSSIWTRQIVCNGWESKSNLGLFRNYIIKIYPKRFVENVSGIVFA